MGFRKVGAKKTVKAAKTKKNNNQRKAKRQESYAVYIYNVLKQVHPELEISIKAMNIMNQFINDIFHRITVEISNLIRFRDKNRKTLRPREIQTVVKLLFPGDLALFAIAKSAQALKNKNSIIKQQQADVLYSCQFQE
ncbi:unnamed protein product [Paramecium octaurelia]|uniref:Core Histone H2A/H2B/H3 domain-containing protein n=1 Tax=Paramecium octaurelia TaxID=43137 RepID=A0A8S1YJM7_PAROT|nr:unnamed protein product [Paramecium octaurelia]